MKNEKLKNELLDAWESTYKKGQLTFWIFLALKQGTKYVDEIKKFVDESTEKTMTCEDQSLYRSLRKYQHLGVVNYENRKGNKGPERKYYYLTELGNNLLSMFIKRNISIFFNKTINKLINE